MLTLFHLAAFTGLVLGAPAKEKPLLRDFIGINTHTIQMKTELYKPVTSLLRNYHPVEWDLRDDPGNATWFPVARNNVNWRDLYGSWVKSGYRVDVSVMFESIKLDKWKNIPSDAFEYGRSFARFFGPSGKEKLVESMEIGNEPTDFNDAQYRQMFENMAKGIREGDPKMLIATCAVAKGKEDKYSKDVANFAGLEKYIDVVNVHTYAFAEMWPTFRRSYPEDPKIKYLKQIQEMIDWRDQKVPGRKVWVTEFGWDCSTKPPPATGDFAKFIGNTDQQQAQYLIRSFLVFSAMDIDRAYMYWFNDDDAPTMHAASGLTRNYQPKPSFHAQAYLYKTLGDFRFEKTVAQKEGDVYAYLYTSSKDPKEKILVAWSPTGGNRIAKARLSVPGKVVKAEKMPLKEGPAPSVPVQASSGNVSLEIDESPTFIWLTAGS